MLFKYEINGTIDVPDGTELIGSSLILPDGQTLRIYEDITLNHQDITCEVQPHQGVTIQECDISVKEIGLFDTDLIYEAFAQSMCLDIIYDGKPKTVEVCAYGLSTKDNQPVMRVFQVAGESSRPLPTWAMLKLSGITSLNLSQISSEGPRPGYKMGDSHMTTIFKELKL